MQRLEHISTIFADLGDIFTFIAPITAVPIIVAILFSEWNMILPMAAVPAVFFITGMLFKKLPRTSKGVQALYGNVFGCAFLVYLCYGQWYTVHARVAYGIH